MNDARMLVVGKDDGIARGWVDHLRGTGAHVATIPDGPGSLRHLALIGPEVVLIDLRLDGPMDAYELCRTIRGRSAAVIVLAGAHTGPFDEIAALSAGADHCVCGDLALEVLVARLRSLLRRARGVVVAAEAPSGPHSDGSGGVDGGANGHMEVRARRPGVVARSAVQDRTGARPALLARTEAVLDGVVEDDRIVEGDLEIDLLAREVHVAGRLTPLTRIEFDLLVTLASQPRRVFTRDQLMSSAWDDPFDGSHVLDTHLSRLRGKVSDAGGERVAHAVRGVGYRLRS